MSGTSKIQTKPTMPPKPAPTEAAIERLIAGAPDARTPTPAQTKSQARPRKTAISLTLSDEVIETMDRKRAALGGLSRPAFIALAISKFEG